jgi:pimeloyl-ACP methyl ester carboxylesterase
MARIALNGVEIDYAVEGPESGTPLLLVMGLAMQRTAWPPRFIEALIARGFRVITFDNRDVGLSTRFESHGTPNLAAIALKRLVGAAQHLPFRLHDIADDAAALLAALKIETAHVAGISMGGMVAQHLAIRHAPRVRTLTLMATSSGRLGLPLPRPKVMNIVRTRPYSGDVEAAVDYSVRLFTALAGSRFPPDRAWLEKRARLGAERALPGTGVLRQFAAIMADADRREQLRDVRTPTLILHGDEDPMVPVAHAHDLRRVLPHAVFEIIPGWGHDLPQPLFEPFAHRIAQLARIPA